MRNVIILVVFLLLLCICAFLASCDDFFSPTIEIFNKIENPTTIEQDHGQLQNQEQKKNKNELIDIINQEQY